MFLLTLRLVLHCQPSLTDAKESLLGLLVTAWHLIAGQLSLASLCVGVCLATAWTPWNRRNAAWQGPFCAGPRRSSLACYRVVHCRDPFKWFQVEIGSTHPEELDNTSREYEQSCKNYWNRQWQTPNCLLQSFRSASLKPIVPHTAFCDPAFSLLESGLGNKKFEDQTVNFVRTTMEYWNR